MAIEQPPKPELPQEPDIINKPPDTEGPEFPGADLDKPDIQPAPPPTDPEPPAI
jgi:hypothetical protein